MLVENIRALCREHGISVRQLERALGFSNGIISSWNTKDPALTRIKAVADYFGVTIDDLLMEKRK